MAQDGQEDFGLRTAGPPLTHGPEPRTLFEGGSLPTCKVAIPPGGITNRVNPSPRPFAYTDIELGGIPAAGHNPVENDSVSPSRHNEVATGEQILPQPPTDSAIQGMHTSQPLSETFLANLAQNMDIITFCSHALIDATLGGAHITYIQARKSSRPPFLHEYLLVFFTTSNNDRFVIRIDRLGKVMSMPPARSRRTHHATASTAIHGVKVYHIQDPLTNIHSIDVPWLAADGRWGSRPVATLATWESLRTSEAHVSHHVRSGGMNRAQPEIEDVSGLLEAILLEMPNYHLTTANCYFMTRSSLILLQRCYPNAFACFLGTITDQMVPASALAQPVWTGLLRWYLPFVILFFLSYVILLIVVHQQVLHLVECPSRWYDRLNSNCHPSSQVNGALFALHAVLDAPLPIGLLHGYMTSLEVEMNKLIGSLSARFSGAREPSSEPSPLRPFGVLFEAAWRTTLAWCLLGFVAGAFIFASSAFEYGSLMVFVFLLIGSVTLDLKIGTKSSGPLPDQAEMDNMFSQATPV